RRSACRRPGARCWGGSQAWSCASLTQGGRGRQVSRRVAKTHCLPWRRPYCMRPSKRERAMIVIHHLNNSRSQRILWLPEEPGAPYEIKFYQRDATTNLAPPELQAVHPLGKSPVMTDGELTIAESGAIVDYLIRRHGGGRLAPKVGTDED